MTRRNPGDDMQATTTPTATSDKDDDDMTDTTEAPPGSQAAPAASTGPTRRHRTVGHVTTHGVVAGGLSSGAAAFHAFGPTGLGVGAAAVAVVGGGVIALRRGRKNGKQSAGRPRPLTRRRPVREPGSRRASAAGLKHKTSASRRTATATATPGRGRATASRAKGATPSPSRSRRAAGLRPGHGATPRRATRGRATASRPGANGGTTRRGGTSTAPATRRRRARASIARPAPGASRGATPRTTSRRGSGTTTRPGSTPRATPRTPSSTRPARARLRRASTGDARASRPTPRMTAASRPTAPSSRQRRAVRTATRRASTARRFVVGGMKAAAPFFRLRPPRAERAQRNEETSTPAATTAPRAAKKTAAAPARRRTAQRPETRPGRALTPPGLTVKDIMTTAAPSACITAAADGIEQHIGGFEPQNMLEVLGFADGLEHLLTTLGTSLITVADRFGGDNPVDASVVDQISQLGAHILEFGQWGAPIAALFRAAHAAELERIEQPRNNEEAWDVQNNR